MGIISVTLSSILLDGFQVSNKQTSTLTMQQQANYLLVVWREMQENGNPYEIILNDEKTQITFRRYDKNDSTKLIDTNIISSDVYRFEIYVDNSSLVEPLKIIPKTQKNIPIKIMISHLTNVNEHYQIQTVLSRL